MFLLIWFKAGLQTSPPIVPLDRETQAQSPGKLLLYSGVAWDMELICGFRAGQQEWRIVCLWSTSVPISSVCSHHPVTYREKKRKIRRGAKSELGLRTTGTRVLIPFCGWQE